MFTHIDTETTGVPINGAQSDDPRHPHLVSLTTLLDENGDAVKTAFSAIIKPLPGIRYEDFPEAFAIHGITTERANAEGVELNDALDEMLMLARQATTFVAFSAFFDFKILKIACARAKRTDVRDYLETMQSICTMESAANHLTGKRFIKLKVAYWELFHEETQTDKHHGSFPDAMASRRIYWELFKRKALNNPKPMAAKKYDTPYVAPSGPAPKEGISAEVEL